MASKKTIGRRASNSEVKEAVAKKTADHKTSARRASSVKPKAKPKSKAKPKANKASKRKGGRRSVYTEAMATEICNRLAAGESLRQICRDAHLPDERRVRDWAINDDHPISKRYDRARVIGCHSLADEILEISDDGSNDWIERENKDGSKTKAVDHEHVHRSRLRVESRKWLLSKLLPKTFGDKISTELSGVDGRPIEITTSEKDDLHRKIDSLAANIQATRTDRNAE